MPESKYRPGNLVLFKSGLLLCLVEPVQSNRNCWHVIVCEEARDDRNAFVCGSHTLASVTLLVHGEVVRAVVSVGG
jgi:hypothetical protein